MVRSVRRRQSTEDPGRGLADAVDLATYTTELHGDAALQWAYAKDPAHGFDEGVLHPR